MFRDYLQKIIDRKNLSEPEMSEMIEEIFSGKLSNAQIGAFMAQGLVQTAQPVEVGDVEAQVGELAAQRAVTPRGHRPHVAFVRHRQAGPGVPELVRGLQQVQAHAAGEREPLARVGQATGPVEEVKEIGQAAELQQLLGERLARRQRAPAVAAPAAPVPQADDAAV